MKKKIKWFNRDRNYVYGYMKGNTLVHIFSVFRKKGKFELAIYGHWHTFKKLSTAKKVGELIYNG